MNNYKKIIEEAPDGVVILSGEKIKYINSCALKTMGREREDVLGSNFFELVSEPDKYTVKKEHTDVLELKKKCASYEVNFIKKDGSLFRVEVKINLVSFKKKDLFFLILREVESRKKIDEIFYRQEQRFRVITDNTPDMIARFDEDCRYVYVNDAMEEVFGVPKKEFFWKTDQDLGIEGERTPLFCDAIQYVFENKKKKEFYIEEDINNERRYFYTIVIPEFFDDGSVCSVLTITRDITEIKEIDQVKSEFVSITTHQLRSPLSAINWCTQSLLKGEAGELNEEQVNYLENINESAQKLIKITDVFLQTTVIDLEMFILNLEEVDSVELLKKVTRSFSEKIKEKDISIKEEYEEIPLIMADPRMLNIIFRNIILNAIEYNSEKGHIDVSLKSSNGKIIFEVGDSGCGISQEDQDKIFGKFYRSEDAKNIRTYGTGLDLYIVKSLIEKMKGEIKVFSPNEKFGKGSVFQILIPVICSEDNCSGSGLCSKNSV